MTYWWVTAESYTWGPFDTERDAHVAQKALSTHAEWLNWTVVEE